MGSSQSQGQRSVSRIVEVVLMEPIGAVLPWFMPYPSSCPILPLQFPEANPFEVGITMKRWVTDYKTFWLATTGSWPNIKRHPIRTIPIKMIPFKPRKHVCTNLHYKACACIVTILRERPFFKTKKERKTARGHYKLNYLFAKLLQKRRQRTGVGSVLWGNGPPNKLRNNNFNNV